MTTYTNQDLTWIDLKSPSNEEISGLVKRYSLHPLIGEELRSSSLSAKIDLYPECIFIVLTLPVRTKTKNGYRIVDKDINFVIGRNFLITSHRDTIEQLEYFSKVFEANSILNKKGEKLQHAGHLFYFMIKRIYSGMIQDLENIRDSLLNSESHIFKGDERKMVRVLSAISRELIDFKQTARAHSEIWEEMVKGGISIFGDDFSTYIKDIHAEFAKIHDLTTNARELLTDLRETNDSLLNTKQNETMKILTLVAFIFYPITFIASIFTIPAINVPIVTGPNGWWILMTLMVIVVFIMLWYFKKKDWL